MCNEVWIVIESDWENGEIYVDVYKNKEVAKGVFERKRSEFSQEKIDVSVEGYYFTAGSYTCGIQKKVIHDA